MKKLLVLVLAGVSFGAFAGCESGCGSSCKPKEVKVKKEKACEDSCFSCSRKNAKDEDKD